MPNPTRQPNTAAPERQTVPSYTAGTSPGQRSRERDRRRRRKKRPPLSTVLFPRRAQRTRRRRRQLSAPDSRAERRKQKLKRQQRYRFLYKVFTLVLTLCAGVLALTLFFKVDTVRIQGRSRYTNAELLQTAEIEPGDNLFLLSRRGVRRRLLDQYPYLDTVVIDRKLPNQIIIRVADAKPAVAIGSETTYYYIDAGGKLLEQVAVDRLGSVPVVTGVTVKDMEVGKRLNMRKDEKLRLLSQLLASLQASGLMDRVDFINFSDLNNVRVGCDGHMYIRFGTMDRLEKKMQFAQKFVEETSASLYCEIEVSGEILWEGRESYRVIPVSPEEVAAQSRDLDEAIIVDPALTADPNADPGVQPGTDPNAAPSMQSGADPNAQPPENSDGTQDGEPGNEPAPVQLPQSGPPSLAGSKPPETESNSDRSDDSSDSDEESEEDRTGEPDRDEAGSTPAAKPSRYTPSSGGSNWRTGLARIRSPLR